MTISRTLKILIIAALFTSCSKEGFDDEFNEFNELNSKEISSLTKELTSLGVYQYSSKQVGSNAYELSTMVKNKPANIKFSEYKQTDILNPDGVIIKKVSYLDPEDQFEIEMTKNSFKYKDNKGVELVFTLHGKEILNSSTQEKIDPFWYKNLNIEENKLFLAGKLVEDAVIKKIINTDFPSKTEQESRSLLLNAIAFPASEGSQPCTRFCTSGTWWHLSGVIACEGAKADPKLYDCCVTPNTIGCCSILGCDCISLIGSYYTWCTAKAYAPEFL